MLKDERQQNILETLRKNGRVLAGELSQRFNVSEDTIRRDLRELADAGQLQRVHGGGLPQSPAATSYRERLGQASEAKKAIALAAVRLVQNGQVILLDGGTTTLSVAQQFPPGLRATVVTNSPLIAAELAEHDGVEVVVIGENCTKIRWLPSAQPPWTCCARYTWTCVCWEFAACTRMWALPPPTWKKRRSNGP